MLWEDLEPYEQPEQNHVQREHLAYYRKIIGLRNAQAALRLGSFRTLLCDESAEVWAFLRKAKTQQALVALNASENPRQVSVPLPPGAPASWTVVFGEPANLAASDGKLTLAVPAIGGVVAMHSGPA